MFYDMTTLYFESSDEDDLRRTGFSKDGKHQCPQIYLGLLVATVGNPIGYEIFEGNIFEGHTFIPVLQKMAERFSLGKPVVIADAGLLSGDNIMALEVSGYKYILGARPKNVEDKIKNTVPFFEKWTVRRYFDGRRQAIDSLDERQSGKERCFKQRKRTSAPAKTAEKRKTDQG